MSPLFLAVSFLALVVIVALVLALRRLSQHARAEHDETLLLEAFAELEPPPSAAAKNLAS